METILFYMLDLLMLMNTVTHCGHAQADRPRATLIAGPTTIQVGGSVTLSCSVETSAGWKYRWFRWTTCPLPVKVKNNTEHNRVIKVTQGGLYQCGCVGGTPDLHSYLSNKATIKITFSNEVVVTQQSKWPQIFSGETITLTCEVQGGETREWTYEWRRSGSFIHRTQKNNLTFSVYESNSGDYRCLCLLKDDWYSSTQWSKPIILSVLRKPKAQLSADSTELPVGGNVTLTCSMNSSLSSFGWKYFWYRGEKSSEPLTPRDAVFLTNGQIHVSYEGLFWCRGGRGEPVYYTDFSDHISISKNVSVESSCLVRSSFRILLIVGPVSAILLIFLLLLLWHFRKSKDFGHMRSIPSQSFNQSFTTNHGVNQAETYENICPPQDESRDATYSLIEMKNFRKERSPLGPEEGAVCPDVKTEAAGKWSPAAEAAVYSVIESGSALANHAAMYS